MAGWIILFILILIIAALHVSARIFVSYDEDGFSLKISYFGITIYPRPPKAKKGSGEEDLPDKSDKSAKSKNKSLKSRIKEKVREKSSNKKNAENFDDDYDYDDVSDLKIDNKDDVICEVKSDFEDADIDENQKVSDKNEDKIPEKDQNKDSTISKEDEELLKGKKSDEKEDKPQSALDKLKNLKEKYGKYIPYAFEKIRKLLKAVRLYDVDVEITSGKSDACKSAIFYGRLNAALFGLLAALAQVFTLRVEKAQVNLRFNEDIFKFRGKTVILLRPSTFIAIIFCIAAFAAKEFLAYKIKQKIKKRKELKSRKAEEK